MTESRRAERDAVTSEGHHRHVIYKRSSLPEGLDIDRAEHGRKDRSCGVRETARANEQRERWESHQRRRREGRAGAGADHSRKKRSFSTERYVETLIVVDPSMIAYHKNEHLETYVLTIMNMVSVMFHDASIGNSINIVLVRILLMEEEQDELLITHHADRTLTSFCKFQQRINFKDDDHPSHHDVAVLLTRKNICSRLNEPCGTLGLAQVSGMCQPHRSCSVSEDTGLALAYTVTHEMGHNFGMPHDGPHNGCIDPPGLQLFIMSPSLVADSRAKTWSNCSREAITKFIDRDWGYCLDDEPAGPRYQLPVLPPGTMYDAEHQCRLQYGTDNATVCSNEQDVCSNLWCRVDSRCSTHLEAAAEGTICGTNMWCYEGKCVTIGERPEAINGEWGQWTSWTQCTRTCGAGVSHSSRHCDNPAPSHGGKYCLGERRRFRICNTEECPDENSFQEAQCEEFNVVPYKGAFYHWEHVNTPETPCQLHCKPREQFFSVLLRDIVEDGTPCTPGTRNMCISGRCRHIGCDYAIDSTAREDRCGICHGDGTTCTTVKSRFTDSQGLGEYLLNGHWFIQWSGEYKAAGTTIQYKRVGNHELVKAPGPLREPLHVMLLMQSSNPGISFEYTVPKLNISEYREPEFYWHYQPWTHCTASCGGGSQRSEIVCMELEAGLVEDKYCDANNKPDDKQRVCNEHQCPARWWTGPWQHCSMTCGESGVHQRTVICVRSLGPEEQIALDDEACDTSEKPPEVEHCHRKDPCPGNSTWVTGEWSDCDANPCGLKYRSVWCKEADIGCQANTIPPSEAPCTGVGCGEWAAEDWSQCTVSCGEGRQTRRVWCEGGDHCDLPLEPIPNQPCNLGPCPTTAIPTTTTTTTSTTIQTTARTTVQSAATTVPSSSLTTTIAKTISKHPSSVKIESPEDENVADVTEHKTSKHIERTVANTVETPATDVPSDSIEKSHEATNDSSMTDINGTVATGSVNADEDFIEIEDIHNKEKQTDDSLHLILHDSKENDDTTGNVVPTSASKFSTDERPETTIEIDTTTIMRHPHRHHKGEGDIDEPIEHDITTEVLIKEDEGVVKSNKEVDDDADGDVVRSEQVVNTTAQDRKNISEKLRNTEMPDNSVQEHDKKDENTDIAQKNLQLLLPKADGEPHLPVIEDFGSLPDLGILHQLPDNKHSLLKGLPSLEDLPQLAEEDLSVTDTQILSHLPGQDKSKGHEHSENYIVNKHTAPRNKIGNAIHADSSGAKNYKPILPQHEHEITEKPSKDITETDLPLDVIPETSDLLHSMPAEENIKLGDIAAPDMGGSLKLDSLDSIKEELGDNLKMPEGAVFGLPPGSVGTMPVVDEHTRRQYEWRPADWTECSRPCGGGVRTRVVQCIRRTDDAEGDTIYCDINTRPSAIEDCNKDTCLEWNMSPWGQCSSECGSSWRRRLVECPGEGACDSKSRPNTEEPCDKPKCVIWVSGQWSKCTQECGGGEQYRLVQCVNVTSQRPSHGCNRQERPDETQACNTDDCANKNAAMSIQCQHNEMSSIACRALMNMGQCHKRFVALKCCKTCSQAEHRRANKLRPHDKALR
ncbi:ATS7-like protein [Mya arenaria]|uniref:ATS7-like protein n=1 Tax=Mya arenaria TaxID=6604 RepID=A0ABY7DRS2_MYAAR|nr:ATS7-like protein [Mya arenaria]